MITNLNIGRYGRLGNQLYQYASSFSLSKKINTELWIPVESEFYRTNGRYNPTIKKNDEYGNDLFKLFDLKFCKKKPLIEIQKSIKYYYNEPNIVKYYPEFWNQKDGTCLHGYFQAKEYVDEYGEDLRRELELQNFYFDYGNNFIVNLKKNYKDIFSVHIRRGDLTMDNHAFNAELSIDNYYKKIISENVKSEDVVLIFSDDIDWCKKNLKLNNKVIFVDSNIDILDLFLMSFCNNNIIANSSFSWWGAYLNENKEKKVIVPKKWFGEKNKHLRTEDIYCKNWIKL